MPVTTSVVCRNGPFFDGNPIGYLGFTLFSADPLIPAFAMATPQVASITSLGIYVVVTGLTYFAERRKK